MGEGHAEGGPILDEPSASASLTVVGDPGGRLEVRGVTRPAEGVGEGQRGAHAGRPYEEDESEALREPPLSVPNDEDCHADEDNDQNDGQPQPRRPRPRQHEGSGGEGHAEQGKEERARTPSTGGGEEEEGEPESREVADEVAVAQRATGRPFRREEGRSEPVRLGERGDGREDGSQREGVEERAA